MPIPLRQQASDLPVRFRNGCTRLSNRSTVQMPVKGDNKSTYKRYPFRDPCKSITCPSGSVCILKPQTCNQPQDCRMTPTCEFKKAPFHKHKFHYRRRKSLSGWSTAGSGTNNTYDLPMSKRHKCHVSRWHLL